MNPSKKKTATQKNELTELDVFVEKIEALEAQVLELTEKNKEAEDAKMRALADLQNYQRRENENKKNWSQFAIAEFLKNFFPNLLELQLGAEHSKNKDFESVVAKFFKNLEKQNISRIVPQKGDCVDPEIHDVIMAGEGKSGAVVQVFEPGWKMNDFVILPAKVSAG